MTAHREMERKDEREADDHRVAFQRGSYDFRSRRFEVARHHAITSLPQGRCQIAQAEISLMLKADQHHGARRVTPFSGNGVAGQDIQQVGLRPKSSSCPRLYWSHGPSLDCPGRGGLLCEGRHLVYRLAFSFGAGGGATKFSPSNGRADPFQARNLGLQNSDLSVYCDLEDLLLDCLFQVFQYPWRRRVPPPNTICRECQVVSHVWSPCDLSEVGTRTFLARTWMLPYSMHAVWRECEAAGSRAGPPA